MTQVIFQGAPDGLLAAVATLTPGGVDPKVFVDFYHTVPEIAGALIDTLNVVVDGADEHTNTSRAGAFVAWLLLDRKMAAFTLDEQIDAAEALFENEQQRAGDQLGYIYPAGLEVLSLVYPEQNWPLLHIRDLVVASEWRTANPGQSAGERFEKATAEREARREAEAEVNHETVN